MNIFIQSKITFVYIKLLRVGTLANILGEKIPAQKPPTAEEIPTN